MAKRFTDTGIWKKQKWFKALAPINKLIFLYIKDNCDHAGFWKVDAIQVMEDIGIESIDLKEFINSCNKDYDAFTGKEVQRDRIRIVKDNLLWITGFVQFQYENKDNNEVNPHGNFAKGAINVLKANNLLEEAVNKGYVTLTVPCETLSNPTDRVKGRGRVKGKGKGSNKKKGEKSEKSKEGPVALIQKADTKEDLLAIWEAYRKKKGKHMTLYERDVILNSTWLNESIHKIKKTLLYTIENSWTSLQEPKTKKTNGRTKSDRNPNGQTYTRNDADDFEYDEATGTVSVREQPD